MQGMWRRFHLRASPSAEQVQRLRGKLRSVIITVTDRGDNAGTVEALPSASITECGAGARIDVTVT
jgi:hypothetical protein